MTQFLDFMLVAVGWAFLGSLALLVLAKPIAFVGFALAFLMNRLSDVIFWLKGYDREQVAIITGENNVVIQSGGETKIRRRKNKPKCKYCGSQDVTKHGHCRCCGANGVE